jgi:hypothetical protein
MRLVIEEVKNMKRLLWMAKAVDALAMKALVT